MCDIADSLTDKAHHQQRKSEKFGDHVSVCAMASRTGIAVQQGCSPGGAWIVPCNKPAAKVLALTCIFSLLCRRFLVSSDHQLLFILLAYFVPVVIFSLLSIDTAIPEDFDDLRVP